MTAASRSAALLRQLDQARATDPDGMDHAPTCQRLVVVVTKGYTHTVRRCDECGACATTRHIHPTPQPQTKGTK